MKKLLRNLVVVLVMFGMSGIGGVKVSAITSEKEALIVEKCDKIKESLTNLQHNDSRLRVYLGRRYETIITNYIKPLNVSLVENNLSTTAFINNQNNFVAARQNFVIDFIEYQKALEELVASDCKHEPANFYEKLETTRARRKSVADDVSKLWKLGVEQVSLATGLEGEL